MKPSKQRFEEARIVLENPGAFSKSYVKTCQLFRDQHGAAHSPQDDFLDGITLKHEGLDWRDVVRALIAMTAINHEDIFTAVDAIARLEAFDDRQGPSIISCGSCGKEYGMPPSVQWEEVTCLTCGGLIPNHKK